MFKVLDLFSGIGGFSLGLERTGRFETVAFCEIEEFPRRVLANHWPKVPCYHDVRELTADVLRRDGIAVDVICGGFPCQDISAAGKGAGLAGQRSGLWREYARLIGEIRPQFVLVENVAALLGRGLGDVLGDLASLGYDAEWDCIPASAIGAPHRRDRVWIVAYPNSARSQGRFGQIVCERPSEWAARTSRPSMADAARKLLNWRGKGGAGWRRQFTNSSWWIAEPDVGRVADGVPARVDRLRGLGNAIVPEVAYQIFRAIAQSEALNNA